MSSSVCDNYPKLQEFDVKEILLRAAKILKWGCFFGEIVMDVGCGDGSNSTSQIARIFQDSQKIIAIDIIPSTINIAKEKHPHPKVQYKVANIEDRSTLTPWLGKISKLISVHCFTFLENQALAFENVYDLLSPGGEAAIMFSLQSCYFDTFLDLVQQTKWKDHFRNIDVVLPESHIKKFDASHYLPILKKIGFQVVLCRDEEKIYFFQSEEKCKKFIANRLLSDQIPTNQREEFNQAVFETFMKHNTPGCSNYPRMYYRILSVLVRKLETSF